ncbi:efflux RND transporter permease subunit [Citromicrobium bathyomarinum]|uniref:efflux RND transporter permease subunit n=1 Tax=unclassified Citromicrobium TaxID=2630544 RepID=UPI0006C93416|nr:MULTISPECIES: efflux RND transporter permease subunit [unclassified Citromicrobium]KPM18282.1 multidrug transporter [Citromicrobium sp. WPS32]KPM24816.1 multidrug transporter [Citromicrobium sp. RCC1885]KPM28059.1 multidrug transporter [Citromicrobium sp. RCC1878]OAM10430.1 multidrug efflux RND transporter permease subunit [Citromicrobium sp. RCC1897]|tara:strand:- start:2128 stop:5373 length:3246 start_codon:yes stop_codon:yes gene_type:complete
MSRFFIDRPIFAWVVSLGILLAGFLALRALPIEQYPEVAPPSLTISVVYPGADAETLEENVTQVIEQQLNGVDGFLYMSSSSISNGTATITVTFEAGTDIDIAQTEVQNRLSTVEARLPEEVRRQGITVRQANSGFLMIVALTSKGGQYDTNDLGNIASTQVVDELRRVNGVGDVQLFGSEYAMRIWLDPDALASYKLSPSAVLAAIREQNAQTAGGSIGAQPLADGQQITATISTDGRFTTAEEFENIILRASNGAAVVRLGEVARVEIGAQTYASSTALNGKPMAGMAVQLATGANALAAAEGVKERLEEIAPGLPGDVTWSIPYDTTPFVEASVEEVVKTLVEAMFLVFLVMFLFLQNWRATLIPTLVVPIALAGACLGLWLFGFSINVLSLFGMVLAIGILVDDAIVVIENVERIMREEGLPPVQATRKAMGQISGAIIGITLVLVAVFLPMAFFPGSTGGIYRQFSVTLAIAIFFSAFLALSLTPALCATFLKPIEKGHDDAAEIEVDEEAEAQPGWRGRLARARGKSARFFARFNRWFARMQEKYGRANDRILSRPFRALAVFLALALVTVLLFMRLPTAFLPTEDQGYLITAVQAPPGATQERTDEALEPIADYWMQRDEVANLVVVRGFSFFGQGQNNAIMFASFKPWSERTGKGSSAGAMLEDATGVFSQVEGALAFVIQPPAIQSLGEASGFTLKLQDRGGVGREALTAARDQLLGMASQSDVIANLRPEDQGPSPEVEIDIDRVQARALGLSLNDVNAALSITFGSAYANDFNRQGRVLQVLVQADAPYRMTPEDVLALRIPNDQGELVPFSAFASAKWSASPQSLSRYNGYPAMTLSGMAAPGKSSGAALTAMEQMAEQLPQGIGYEWTGISYEEKQAGGQIGLLLGLSVVIVFLVLAALYESWAVPLAVLLIVPMGVLGAVLFSMFRGLSADVYFNVGLITIIGLAAKNAILIVEFAIEEEQRGLRRIDAVKAAAKLRLRPIIMTSLAFTMGMVPLVLASGAGAASRIAVGTGVMGGMIAATVLGIFLIPMLYLLVRRKISRKQPQAAGHLDDPEDSKSGPEAEGEKA